MPSKPAKPCRYPNCNKLTHDKYCPEHAALVYKDYNKNKRDPNTSERYNDPEWQYVRTEYLAHHVMCEVCRKNGHMIRATEVHHVKPLSEGGTNAKSNLIALCHVCHTRIHGERGDYKSGKKVYTY